MMKILIVNTKILKIKLKEEHCIAKAISLYVYNEKQYYKYFIIIKKF